MFDSHSRNQYGLCCADGTSVLGLMVALNDFCVYISQLVMSMNKNPDVVQFDLHCFVLQKNTKSLVKHIEIFDNSVGYRKVDEPKRKRKESHSSEKRHCIEKLMKGKSFSQCVDDCNVASFITWLQKVLTMFVPVVHRHFSNIMLKKLLTFMTVIFLMVTKVCIV